MTLTEQLKKGELKDGHYFFKTKDNIKIGFLYEGFKYPYDGRYNTIDNVEEVLAPVPSYEEYLSLTYAKEEDEKIIAEYEKENAQLHKFLEEFNALDVAKENQQLKELLKECREWIYEDMSEDFEEGRMEFLTEIDNAIGEKK